MHFESLWGSFPAACCGFVIPAKAGIQVVMLPLDTRRSLSATRCSRGKLIVSRRLSGFSVL